MPAADLGFQGTGVCNLDLLFDPYGKYRVIPIIPAGKNRLYSRKAVEEKNIATYHACTIVGYCFAYLLINFQVYYHFFQTLLK